MRPPARVQYLERQRLRFTDLRAEQDYLLGLAGRHYLGPHDWGIVRGLYVEAGPNPVITIQPGLAVDGYGRELLISKAVEKDLLPNDPEQFVYLYYCERPEGSCGDIPNTRWRDSAEMTISGERWPIPEQNPDLLTALAARSFPDLPAWPVLLGVVNRDSQNNTWVVAADASIKYTSARAARITSPSGQSLLTVGRENLADQFHLRVSTKNEKGSQQNRLAVDQDGNPNFWKNLVIAGSARNEIQIQIGNLTYNVKPGSSSGDLHWRSFIESTDDAENVVIAFRSGSRAVAELNLRSDLRPGNKKDHEELKKRVADFNRRQSLVEIVPTLEVSKKGKALAPAVAAVPMLKLFRPEGLETPEDVRRDLDSSEKSFSRQDVKVLFRQPGDRTLRPCGCSDDENSRKKNPAGLTFRPGTTAPLPPARDIYNIRVLDDEGKLVDHQLRISAGVFQEGDFRTSFSIGAQLKQSANGSRQTLSTPWLIVRGNGEVELPGGLDDLRRPLDMIDVKGTLHLPPLKPDPRDPLFNHLLLLSFIYGVLQRGASQLQIPSGEPPAFIETSQPWSYVINLRNLGSVKLTGPTGKEFFNNKLTGNSLPLPAEITTSARVVIPREPGDLPAAIGDQLTVKVAIAMQAGPNMVAAEFSLGPIEVRKSPTIDLDTLPGTVPPGWAFPIQLTNRANRNLQIVGDVKVENLGNQQLLKPALNALTPNQSTTTALARIPIDAVSSVKPKVTLNYAWPPDTSERSVIREKQLTIKKHLELSIRGNAKPNQPWEFELWLKNVSGRTLTLSSLKVWVYRDATPLPAPVHFPNLNEVITNGVNFIKGGLNGVPAPAGAVIRIDIEVAYTRLNRTWDPVSDTTTKTI